MDSGEKSFVGHALGMDYGVYSCADRDCFALFLLFWTIFDSFLFTNLPVTLLAMFLIPFAFFWLGYPVDFCGYDWIQKIVEGLVHGMVRVVDVFSALPYATITGRFSFFEMLGGYGFLVLCLMYMKIRGTQKGFLLVRLNPFVNNISKDPY